MITDPGRYVVRRAKLLGFLPLVTGGGLILLTGRPDHVRREFFGPVGLFGIAVTTGLLAYGEVDLTTPRQSGKTTLELAVLVHRCRTWARSRALYSAQSRIHAHKKWEDEHVATLKASPFAGEFSVRYQRGDEAIRWDNGSLHGITAPGEKSGHSEVLDLAVVDEAWAHEDARLEQGLSPTMITRPQPQLWVVSTAGTHRSAYLRGKVERGRARAASSPTRCAAAPTA